MAFGERTPSDVVASYVQSKLQTSRLVSVEIALRAIKAVVPNCALQDEELVHMLVDHARARGLSIADEGKKADSPDQ